MCNMVKSLMDSKNIKYSVNQDIEEMKSLGITSVPVLYVDGNKKDFVSIMDFIKNYGKE